MKIKFNHPSYRQPLQKARHGLYKTNTDSSDKTKEAMMSGAKGGKVERQRRAAREIDLELRGYIYR